MNNNKQKIIESLKLYLRTNELDSDTIFYSIEKWIEREEEYLIDSEFVIVSEGGLNFMLNFVDPFEFYELIKSFGYFMEMGHSWSYGFYFDENFENINKTKELTYAEKLSDKRWKNKRDRVKVKANYICQDCGDNKKLEVHHCFYKFGLEPWQYPIDSLRCLCSKCHVQRGNIELLIRSRMAGLKISDLDIISEFIVHGMEYYPEDKIIELIGKFDVDKSKIITKLMND